MRESYSEGVASHTGPESCAGAREGPGEALTGVHTGQVLSCEINRSGMPTLSPQAEGNTHVAVRGRSWTCINFATNRHVWMLGRVVGEGYRRQCVSGSRTEVGSPARSVSGEKAPRNICRRHPTQPVCDSRVEAARPQVIYALHPFGDL